MIHSHGRGGAGNMADDSNQPHISPQDLVTPTVKSAVYTTGRGGSGNMAHNDNAAETRLRQDVEPIVRRPSHGAQHSGRGGAGNVFNADELEANKEHRKGSHDNAVASDDEHHHSARRSLDQLAHKGKEMLFGKKH